MDTSSDSTIPPKELRGALGNFATGVTVITTVGPDGGAVGLTVNSFNSVSLDPPLVLWSLALNSESLPSFRAASTWAVHILAADQEHLSVRFSSRGADRFSGIAFQRGPDGVPLLADCTARFICRSTFEYEGGDHAIFVGEVLDLETSGRLPLLFHNGRYRKVLSASRPIAPMSGGDDGEFGRHFIGHLLGRAYHAALQDVRREYRRRGLRSVDYTVLVALGLGDGCPRTTLEKRAAAGGVRLRADAVDRLISRGDVQAEAGSFRLTSQGRRILAELIAVSQATQLRIQSRLATEEFALLMELLEKLSGVNEVQESQVESGSAQTSPRSS